MVEHTEWAELRDRRLQEDGYAAARLDYQLDCAIRRKREKRA